MGLQNLLDHGLVMVLEPFIYDHPGLFLKESPHAYEICKKLMIFIISKYKREI